MRNYVDQAVEEIREQVGKDKVILGLSGGVDPVVARLDSQGHRQATHLHLRQQRRAARQGSRCRQASLRRNFKIKLHYEDSTCFSANYARSPIQRPSEKSLGTPLSMSSKRPPAR